MTAEITAYAWVLDGIPTIFTTDEGLNTAWAVAAGFVSTHAGLQPPTGLACGIELKSGQLTDDNATIQVEDVDGTLATLFRSARADTEPLTNTLEPGDTGGSQVKGKHVGTEYIAAVTGARRQYSCVPGFAVGLKHYGQVEAYENGLGSTPVSDQPVVWTGRRCAIYRVRQIGGTWQALSAAKRVWWGTMLGTGSYRRGTWSFSCLGPQSWVGGNLGRGLFDVPLRAVPITPIDADAGQHRLFSFLTIWNPYEKLIHHDYGDLVDDTYLVGAASYADVAAAMNSFLDDVIANIPNPGESPYNDDANDIRYDTTKGLDGIVVTWKRGDTTSIGDPYVSAGDTQYLCAQLVLWAHENVWRTLGYDVRQQTTDRDPIDNEDQYGRFSPVGNDGYWRGEFWSASPKAMLAVDAGDFQGVAEAEYSSNGGDRRWPPLWPGGAVTFTGAPGQEFELVSANSVLLAGSKSRPLPADPDDDTAPYNIGGGVGDVTDQALLVLEGPYRRRGDDDQVDPVEGYAFGVEKERALGKTVQVVRVGYRRNSDGTVSFGTGTNPRFVTMEWYDPRLFGFDFPPLAGTWGAFRDPPEESEPIEARPLVSFDARNTGDKIGEVIQRILLTTGTAGEWYADAGFTVPLYGLDSWPAYLEVGANDTGGPIPLDAEDATLGLGVPAALVQDPEHWAAAELALGTHLRRCKVAAVGVVSARDLFARLLAPTGLSLSLAGGKFGLIDAWAMPSPGDAVLTITPEQYGGVAGKPDGSTPSQALRKWAPIDKLEIKARIDPVSRDYKVEIQTAATDSLAAYRQHQQIKHTILADYVIDERLKIDGAGWRSDIGVRWRRGFEFWAEDNAEVTAKLHAYDAIDTWPGDAVLVTDSQLVGADGEYGLSVAPGRVLGRIFDAEKEIVTLRILVAGEANFRLYAPAALIERYIENEGGVGYRLEVADDYLGDRGGATLDVEGFAEPSWSSEGGDALIEVWQFDGTSWSGGIYGTVDTVNAVAGSCYIQLAGALTGATFYRDRWSLVVLRDWADQTAAWVLRWLAPITLDDGTAAGAPGEKFNGL
jgi:hypothetical protein